MRDLVDFEIYKQEGWVADSCEVKPMSNSYECSINKNLGYYLKENKLEKYKTRGANTLCGPLGLGKYCTEFIQLRRKLRWTEKINTKGLPTRC